MAFKQPCATYRAVLWPLSQLNKKNKQQIRVSFAFHIEATAVFDALFIHDRVTCFHSNWR